MTVSNSAPTGIDGYIAEQPQKLVGAQIGRATSFVNLVPLSTAGAGTLTAALLQPGNVIQRTYAGAAAGFIDTLDTGANMSATYPEIDIGQSVTVIISNRVGYIQTIAAGTGFTITAGSDTTIAANDGDIGIITRTGANTWTFELM